VRKQSRKGLKLWAIIGLLIALLSLALAFRSRNPYALIKSTKYKNLYPYIIAQAKHESGNFTSRVYRENNNPFGFKEARGRVQVGKRGLEAPERTKEGLKTYYWHYPSEKEAVKDLLTYFDKVGFPEAVNDVTEYASELKARGYFTAPISEYINGLKRFV